MDTSMEEDQQHSIKFIRKLRKKLRQIERLEKAQRELTEEERVKLSCKHDIREKLQSILSTLNEQDISLGSNKTDIEVLADENESEDYESEANDQDASSSDFIPRTSEEMEIDKTPQVAIEHAEMVETKPVSSVPTSQEKKDLKKTKKMDFKSVLRRSWRNKKCRILELKGHNDYVSCTAASDEWVVSGSRDTTVKLWNCHSGKELKSMGGHTGQVTAVYIIDEQCSSGLRSNMDLSTVEVFTDISQVNSKHERVIVSGSTDCSIRLWIVPSGLFVKSIYNYNPVSSLELLRSRKYVLVGSRSGNLTVYDLCSSNQIYSSVVHSNLITTIKAYDDKIITSSADGSIKIWNIESGKEGSNQQRYGEQKFNVASVNFDLRIQYSFDTHDTYTTQRRIHSFDCCGSEICFGDDGCNIKFWDPASGGFQRVRNHRPGVPGITDGVSVEDDLLFTTSYDMDQGIGSINLRSLSKECSKEYIVSLHDKETPRLVTLTTFFSKKLKYLVTGGEKLLIWHVSDLESSSVTVNPPRQQSIISGRKIAGLTQPAVHSDESSDDEASTDDESRWFWQKLNTTRTTEAADLGDHDETSSTDSEDLGEKLPPSKPSKSICNWCTVT